VSRVPGWSPTHGETSSRGRLAGPTTELAGVSNMPLASGFFERRDRLPRLPPHLR